MNVDPNRPDHEGARHAGEGAAPKECGLASHPSARIEDRDLERLTELTDDLFCVIAPGGEVLRVNPAFEGFVGLEAEELTGRSFIEQVHVEDRDRTLDSLIELARTGIRGHFSHRLLKADGSTSTVSWLACIDLERGLIYGTGRQIGSLQTGDHQREEAEAKAEQLIPDVIRHVQKLTIADCEPGPVFEYLMSQILRITGSEQGFIGELEEREGKPALRSLAVDNETWDDESRRRYEESDTEAVELGQLDASFHEVLSSGELVLAGGGEDEGLGEQSGTGGAARSFLGLPLRDNDDTLVGMLGLANRPGGFDASVAELLEPIAATAGRLISNYSVRRARTRESEALRLSEQRWRRSIELAAYPVLVWDQARVITYANKCALELLQYRRHQLVGKGLDDILADADLDHSQALDRMRQDGWSHRITHLKSFGGEAVPVELKAVDLGDGSYQAMVFDMREWVAVETKLKRASQRDNLTGLLNRRAIEEHAEVEIHRARRRAGSISLLLVDIDHFKKVNDQHGHLNGDVALQRVAEVVSASVRPTDWVGRWGGEEILVVLSDTREDEALCVAERIRKSIADKPLEISTSGTMQLTVSIGVASGSIGYVPSLRQFFERVDRALYHAKQQGRDRVVCYQDSTLFQKFPVQESGLSA